MNPKGMASENVTNRWAEISERRDIFTWWAKDSPRRSCVCKRPVQRGVLYESEGRLLWPKQTEQARNRVSQGSLAFDLTPSLYHLLCLLSSQFTPRPHGYHICHWDYKLPLGSRAVALFCDLAGERLFLLWQSLWQWGMKSKGRFWDSVLF